MAHKNTVLQSVNLDGGFVCVDIFQRPDDTYGFDEFRRDPEDGRGWYSIGHYGNRVFDSAAAAIQEARTCIEWLRDYPV
ncbi:hypothetical protein [Leisingera sp. S232]|uniref:hypothetical protein n=1 Tax=Leisingera sp. S232 TaxID=3415132 RepID=UPI003C7BA66B